MRPRRTIWILLCLLLAAGAWLFWPHAKRMAVEKFTPPLAGAFHSASTAPQIFLPAKTVSTNSARNAASVAAKTNQFPYRLSNTAKSIGELVNDRHAILLENALIDTRVKLELSIPKNLQSQGDPGAYIVQAKARSARRSARRSRRRARRLFPTSPTTPISSRFGVRRGRAGRESAGAVGDSLRAVLQGAALVARVREPEGLAVERGFEFGDCSWTSRRQRWQQIEKLGGKILSQDSRRSARLCACSRRRTGRRWRDCPACRSWSCTTARSGE